MAIGTIRQEKGPFVNNTTFQYPPGSYIIGISVGEKDYMSYNNENPSYSLYEDYFSSSNYHQFGDIYFLLNGEEIHIGRPARYETQLVVENPTLVFPQGAPASLIIDLTQIID